MFDHLYNNFKDISQRATVRPVHLSVSKSSIATLPFLSSQGQELWIQTMAATSQQTHKVVLCTDSLSLYFIKTACAWMCVWDCALCVCLYPFETLISPYDRQKALKGDKDGVMNGCCPHEGCLFSHLSLIRSQTRHWVTGHEAIKIDIRKTQKTHFALFNRSPAAITRKMLPLTMSTVIYSHVWPNTHAVSSGKYRDRQTQTYKGMQSYRANL